MPTTDTPKPTFVVAWADTLRRLRAYSEGRGHAVVRHFEVSGGPLEKAAIIVEVQPDAVWKDEQLRDRYASGLIPAEVYKDRGEADDRWSELVTDFKRQNVAAIERQEERS